MNFIIMIKINQHYLKITLSKKGDAIQIGKSFAFPMQKPYQAKARIKNMGNSN